MALWHHNLSDSHLTLYENVMPTHRNTIKPKKKKITQLIL